MCSMRGGRSRRGGRSTTKRASAQQPGVSDAREFAEQVRTMSCGKDGDETALENASAFASGVSHFPTTPAAVELNSVVVLCRERKQGSGPSQEQRNNKCQANRPTGGATIT